MVPNTKVVAILFYGNIHEDVIASIRGIGTSHKIH
uniref:Uncharacterized protein n=1 Tax=Moniliophthora roreri TaxID=221103 RepID=A0A0W0G451_MONRR